MKKFFKFVLMGLGAIVLLAILAAACSSGKEATKVGEKGKEVEATTNSFKIGDTVKVGDWQYTVLGAKEQKTVRGILQQEKPDVEKFVVIKVKVENIGKDQSFLDDNLFKLFDEEEAEYTASSKFHNDAFLKPINPHGKATIEVAFDVPNKKIDSFKLVAKGGMISSDTATIELKK